MRDIRILSMVMRDESVPATLSIIDDDVVVNSPVELDENEKDKLVKRFAERLLLRGCYIGEPDPQDEAREEEPAAAPEAPKPVAKAPVFLRASDLVTTIRRIHRHLAEPALAHLVEGGGGEPLRHGGALRVA